MPIRKASRRLPAAWLLIALLSSMPVSAQFAGADEDNDEASAQEDQRPDGQNMPLPDPMPALPAFEQMLSFTTDGPSRLQYALDMDSVQLAANQAQATIAARSASGVLNIGFYHFDCPRNSYRLAAYANQQGRWRKTSKASRWRDVRLGATHRQYYAVFKALCQQGGAAVERKSLIPGLLADPRRNLYSN